MALRADATLEAFINRIIRNSEIMEILKLPLIEKDDDEELIDEKRKVLIDNKVDFLVDNTTNQIFPILSDSILEELSKKYVYE